MCYTLDTVKREGGIKMTTFTTVVLIMFIIALSVQFVKAIETECCILTFWFAFEIIAFAYLLKVLM